MATIDYSAIMNDLEKMGTAQNIKIYNRHGAGDNLFGVSFANLNILKKRIKIDHNLALRLWKSGNADARCLAIMIADPTAMTPAEAETWVNDITYYLLSDLLAGLIAKTAFAPKKMDIWMKSKKEFVRQCGYNLLAALLRDTVDMSDEKCRAYLRTIEKDIQNSPNRARHAMNMGLIAIGIYKRNLTDEAMATADRIGKVSVDHGETSCKTPDAIPYIKNALKRPPKKKMSSKRSNEGH